MAASHAASEINVVACESCRTKKCKCDRRLPVCSQCVSGGIQCTYPESNKRGFPPGYIAALERRLLETELALFDALKDLQLQQLSSHDDRASDDSSAVQEQQTPVAINKTLTKRSATQSKNEKIAEWEVFPLNSKEQHLVWWRERLSLAGQAGEQLMQRLKREKPQMSMHMPGGTPNQLSFLSELAHQSQQQGSYMSPSGSNDGSLNTENTILMMPPPPRPVNVGWNSSHSPDSATGFSNMQTSPQAQQPSPEQSATGQVNAQFSWADTMGQSHSDGSMALPQGGSADSPNNAYGSGSNSTAQRLSSTQWRRFF